MRLWVTRPQPDADAQAEALRALGHEAIVEPLLDVVYHDAAPLPLDDAQALIVTSRNAVRALARRDELVRLRTLPLFAVGAGTAKAAQVAGFARIIAGDGDAEALVATVVAQCRPQAGVLLHAAGAHLAYDLKAALEGFGFRVAQAVLYTTTARTTLGPALLSAIRSGALDGVILMSPRSARSYVAVIERYELAAAARRLRHYCLSPAIANALPQSIMHDIVVAARPNQAELLALVGTATAH